MRIVSFEPALRDLAVCPSHQDLLEDLDPAPTAPASGFENRPEPSIGRLAVSHSRVDRVLDPPKSELVGLTSEVEQRARHADDGHGLHHEHIASGQPTGAVHGRGRLRWAGRSSALLHRHLQLVEEPKPLQPVERRGGGVRCPTPYAEACRQDPLPIGYRRPNEPIGTGASRNQQLGPEEPFACLRSHAERTQVCSRHQAVLAGGDLAERFEIAHPTLGVRCYRTRKERQQ